MKSEGDGDQLLEIYIQKERQLQFIKRRIAFLRAMMGKCQTFFVNKVFCNFDNKNS